MEEAEGRIEGCSRGVDRGRETEVKYRFMEHEKGGRKKREREKRSEGMV